MDELLGFHHIESQATACFLRPLVVGASGYRSSCPWLDGFEEAFRSLRENPERHGFARENDLYELPYPVRQLLFGIGKRPTHRAVFEVRGDTVYVVAVRHLAQDELSSEEL